MSRWRPTPYIAIYLLLFYSVIEIDYYFKLKMETLFLSELHSQSHKIEGTYVGCELVPAKYKHVVM